LGEILLNLNAVLHCGDLPGGLPDLQLAGENGKGVQKDKHADTQKGYNGGPGFGQLLKRHPFPFIQYIHPHAKTCSCCAQDASNPDFSRPQTRQ
jgi:hypothetical protein